MTDSPFRDGDPPNLVNDHRWQIDDTPIHLSVSKEGGQPRLSLVILETPSGVTLDPPVRVHLATFVSDGHALTVVEFLDTLTTKVIGAIEHYRKLAAPLDITQLIQRIKHGSQN